MQTIWPVESRCVGFPLPNDEPTGRHPWAHWLPGFRTSPPDRGRHVAHREVIGSGTNRSEAELRGAGYVEFDGSKRETLQMDLDPTDGDKSEV